MYSMAVRERARPTNSRARGMKCTGTKARATSGKTERHLLRGQGKAGEIPDTAMRCGLPGGRLVLKNTVLRVCLRDRVRPGT